MSVGYYFMRNHRRRLAWHMHIIIIIVLHTCSETTIILFAAHTRITRTGVIIYWRRFLARVSVGRFAVYRRKVAITLRPSPRQ